MVTLLSNSCIAVLISFGFSLVLNVPHRMLAFCLAGSVIAYNVRELFLYIQFSIEFSSLLASVVVGLFSNTLWQTHLVPKVVFTAISVIPLIPGFYLYSFMNEILLLKSEGYSVLLFNSLLDNGLTALFTFGALSLGFVISRVFSSVIELTGLKRFMAKRK